MKRMRLKLCALLLALGPALALADSLWVVVHPSNPVRGLTPQEVAALYLGRAHSFSTGEFALVFDYPRDSKLRERFFLRVANMTPSQVNTYWSRLMFAGQAMPPQTLPTPQAVTEIIKRNPGAIGYVDSLPRDNTLRVILELKD
jgi:ABC-type phosphate transport system substrate-binding protein